MRAIILSGVAFIATTAVLALACPAHELADMEDELDGRHVTPVSPYADRVALVCVLRCAPPTNTDQKKNQKENEGEEC